jgi:hypothetical protein
MTATPEVMARTGNPAPTRTAALPAGIVLAAVLACTGLFLPATWFAALLAGTESARLPQVIDGVRVFKALLLLHALVVAFLWHAGRRPPAVFPLISVPPAQPHTRGALLLLAALLAAGLLLRVIHLNDALWYDEIAALIDQIRQRPGTMLSSFATQNQHPLYSLLAQGAIRVAGESAWAVRLPAVLLGVGSLAAVYWLGTRISDAREALLATALLAFSYHHVWFSQNARGYAGLLLFALVGTTLLIDILRRSEWRGWRSYIAYAAVMALGVYTHLTAAFVVIAHALVVAILEIRARRHNGRFTWPVVAALVLAGTLSLQLYALVVPQLPATLFGGRSPLADTEWKSPLWLFAESLRGLSRGVPGGWLGIAAAGVVGGAGMVSLARRCSGVLALLVLPPILLAAALVGTHHNLWPRFFFFAAGFAVLIGVRGVFAIAGLAGRQAGPRLATAALIVVILASAGIVGRAWGPKQDYAGARAFVDAQRRAGDAVVIAGMARLPYERYFQTGWLPVTNVRELQAIESTHARTWLLYTVPAHLRASAPDVLQHVEQSYRVARAFEGTLGGGTVYVMVNR